MGHRTGMRSVLLLTSASLMAALLCWCAPPLAAADYASLRDQIAALADRHGIAIDGLSMVADAPATRLPDDAPLKQRFEMLLQRHNYLIVTDDAGAIRSLRIIRRMTVEEIAWLGSRPTRQVGRSRTAAPRATAAPNADRHVVRTTRRRGEHYVTATLEGPDEIVQKALLMVSPAVKKVILSVSLIEELGIDRDALEAGMVGLWDERVPAEHGSLRSIEVGGAVAEGVAVSFIADTELDGAGLIGQSFLNRYHYSLLDSKSQLILEPRR